eukprot:CAMPEP_0204828784 /NCGR_PEP_ID=MMETSP1346-20131115/6706_1 /ASSEMBLY_ACC=CAM_ASM_000771 /TAXON_ID=215587 /ORGANISM="Aplanochytrium stocchinoi, Strain GSBS06" /LENGTH=376 /DNA_ID=CAMNT_0051958107 /DNA_START=43 /DNA_END=1174 /DNA_ORIENTATION=-
MKEASEEKFEDQFKLDNSRIRLSDRINKLRTDTGEKYINEYKVLRRLGQGTFASVKLCERKETRKKKLDEDEVARSYSGQEQAEGEGNDTNANENENEVTVQYAIKSYNKRRLDRIKSYHSRNSTSGGMTVVTALMRVQVEIEILAQLDPHENICNLHEIMEDENCDKLYTILDYLDGGCLMTYDRKTLIHTNPQTGDVLDSKIALQYINDVCHGLQFLHAQGIVHRDIKPENLLLQRQTDNKHQFKCVIADFGCAKQIKGGDIKTGMVTGTEGTYVYFSPQACEGGGYNGYLCDIWALGVTLHVCTFGILPFYTHGMKQLLDLIRDESTKYVIPNESALNHSQLPYQTAGALSCAPFYVVSLKGMSPSDTHWKEL